ncbi:hypothetical protein AX17_006364 [Amanita inopinata Kibby_2008]|nr:hypothetical protein AX17_006364 [Amanita inopinata Kibby_2008]
MPALPFIPFLAYTLILSAFSYLSARILKHFNFSPNLLAFLRRKGRITPLAITNSHELLPTSAAGPLPTPLIGVYADSSNVSLARSTSLDALPVSPPHLISPASSPPPQSQQRRVTNPPFASFSILRPTVYRHKHKRSRSLGVSITRPQAWPLQFPPSPPAQQSTINNVTHDRNDEDDIPLAFFTQNSSLVAQTRAQSRSLFHSHPLSYTPAPVLNEPSISAPIVPSTDYHLQPSNHGPLIDVSDSPSSPSTSSGYHSSPLASLSSSSSGLPPHSYSSSSDSYAGSSSQSTQNSDIGAQRVGGIDGFAYDWGFYGAKYAGERYASVDDHSDQKLLNPVHSIPNGTAGLVATVQGATTAQEYSDSECRDKYKQSKDPLRIYAYEPSEDALVGTPNSSTLIQWDTIDTKDVGSSSAVCTRDETVQAAFANAPKQPPPPPVLLPALITGNGINEVSLSDTHDWSATILPSKGSDVAETIPRENDSDIQTVKDDAQLDIRRNEDLWCHSITPISLPPPLVIVEHIEPVDQLFVKIETNNNSVGDKGMHSVKEELPLSPCSPPSQTPTPPASPPLLPLLSLRSSSGNEKVNLREANPSSPLEAKSHDVREQVAEKSVILHLEEFEDEDDHTMGEQQCGKVNNTHAESTEVLLDRDSAESNVDVREDTSTACAGENDFKSTEPTRPAWSIRAADAPSLGLSVARAAEVHEKVSWPKQSKNKEADNGVEGNKQVEEKSTTRNAIVEESDAEVVPVETGVDKFDDPTSDSSSFPAPLREPTLGSRSSLPGSFPELEPEPSILQPSLTDSTSITAVTLTPEISRVVRNRQSAMRGLPIEIALAMQMRPGLGVGADPAWMVRYLMAVFGWFAIMIAGRGGDVDVYAL